MATRCLDTRTLFLNNRSSEQVALTYEPVSVVAAAASLEEKEIIMETNTSADCQVVRHTPEEAQAEAAEPVVIQGEVVPSTFLTSGEATAEATAQVDFLEDPREHGASRKATFSTDVANSTATVKCMLMPEGHMMTMAFAIGLSIKELKHHFANELKVPSEVIQISLDGQAVDEQRTLMDLGVQPQGTTQLEMSSTDPDNHPIRPAKLQQEYNMPDVITVRVQTDPERGVFQDVVVEIERATCRKAFLGGYRHRLTGTEFHHAGVQTVARRKPDRGVEAFSRDTQTVSVKIQGQQCTNSTSTQTSKIGCYVSNAEDKLVSPGSYVTAAQYHDRRLRAAITLQTYARRWQAKQTTAHLRRDRELRLVWMEKEAERRKEEKEEQVKAEYRRRMDPQNKEDFALLYNALEKWRCEKVEHIDATLTGAERKAALCALLEEETQLIASIGRHRIGAGERNNDKAIQAFLDKCAAPKRWRAFDGKMTQMDTQSTLRATELRDLYTTLNLSYLSQEERLDVLLTLKHTVKEHVCKLTRDMVQLIDREADLMMRGVKETNLEGLRKRISTLFLQYIKTPSFNPEVAKILKVPQDPAKLRKNIYFCRGCNRYLPSRDLALTADARLMDRCRRCAELHNEARSREDVSLYRTILLRLRTAERRASHKDTFTCLLQEKDIQYLVDVVWGAKSALGGGDDLHDLVMVRWDRLCEWRPWNCILLSKDEASAHLKENNIEKAYGLLLIGKVKHKHTLAKKYFSQIPAMAEYLQNVDSQPAAHGNLLVAKTVTAATAKTYSPQKATGKMTQ